MMAAERGIGGGADGVDAVLEETTAAGVAEVEEAEEAGVAAGASLVSNVGSSGLERYRPASRTREAGREAFSCTVHGR